MTPREIVGSRAKTLFHLAISIGFVVLALWMVRSPEGSGWAGWVVLLFFGLGIPVFGWTLVRPQRLTLDVRGFRLSGGLVRSPRQVRWCDVTGFFVYRLPRGGKMIGYNYAAGARPKSLLSRVNHHLGADAALPKAWVGPPERTVAELNEYRAQAMGLPTPPA